MLPKHLGSSMLRGLRISLAAIALCQFTIGASLVNAALPQNNPRNNNDSDTASPIKHVVVIIGENRSFDHVFATYVPKGGQTVWNLLSQKIVNANGTPGPNFSQARQLAADQPPDAFLLSPPQSQFPNNRLPAPLVGGAFDSYIPGDSIANAEATEQGLPAYPAYPYYQYLVSGGTGLPSKTPDTRIANVTSLPAGPFQLTNGKSFVYNDYAASPVHRFYQMWQQLNCGLERANSENPSGCNAQLFSWVEVTVGAGANGAKQPPLCSADGDATPCFATNYLPGVPKATLTGEGSTALGFYNVQQGDAPYLKSLADDYAMSDNFHQSVDGGTGANHIMFGHGDMIWFSDGNGHPAVPPHQIATGAANGVGLDEVENPNPAMGTNNWYTEDGYGAGSRGTPAYGGGSYSDCSDPSQPGVAPIVNYLKSLKIDPRCEKGHYYLLNNYNPGYFGQGENAFLDTSPSNTVFTVPPSSTPSIGDDLNAHRISWKYYGDQWNDYAGNTALGIPEDKYSLNYGAVGSPNHATGLPIKNADEYCNVCNPFQYDTSIMANPAIRAAHLADITGPGGLYTDIANGTLPAVSIVKPSGFVDGHPSSSKLNLFEGFTQKIVMAIQSSPYWKDTAIFITFDEGGGYYDSGYVQPLDFFGDGTRIPLLVVSPYATGGHISHEYSDHVSLLKFIERNWKIGPVTPRSRDNFPNPTTAPSNPYVPLNPPAIGDLFDLFNFGPQLPAR